MGATSMTFGRLALATSLASAVAFGAYLSAQGEGAGAAATCSIAALQQKAPAGTTITGAAVVDATGAQPSFCQVDGHVSVPGNEVNLRIGLPRQWNGKFYFS